MQLIDTIKKVLLLVLRTCESCPIPSLSLFKILYKKPIFRKF